MTVTVAIDTSTDVRVGLVLRGDGGQAQSFSDFDADPRAHAERLMPLLVSVADRAGVALSEVTDVIVGVGPGPFTGLRVGVVTAEILAASNGARLRGVCSLDLAARQHVREAPAAGEFLAVCDARRKEVYWARYAADGRRLDGPFVTAPDALPELPRVGPGAALVGGASTPLDAGLLAEVGAEFPEVGLSPLYLRRPDAEVPTRRKSTLLQPRVSLGRR